MIAYTIPRLWRWADGVAVDIPSWWLAGVLALVFVGLTIYRKWRG